MRRLTPVRVVPIAHLSSRSGVFNPRQIRAICDAFDQAWASLIEAGSDFADPTKATATREILAKRVIDMAEQGMMDVAMLRDDALAHLRSNPPPG